MFRLLFFSTGLLFFISCQHQNKVDSIYFNAQIITMNDSLPSASVLVIKDGKIIDANAPRPSSKEIAGLLDNASKS